MNELIDDKELLEHKSIIRKNLTITLCLELSKKYDIDFTDYTDEISLKNELNSFLSDGIITMSDMLESVYDNFELYTCDFQNGVDDKLLSCNAIVNEKNEDVNNALLYETPICDLDVSLRIKTALSRYGYKRISDIVNLTLEDVSNIGGLGSSSVYELTKKLNEMGIDFYWKREFGGYFCECEDEVPSDNPKHKILVSELNVSSRIKYSLARRGIKYVYDLVQLSLNGIMRTNNFGENSLSELSAILDKMDIDYKWKSDVEARKSITTAVV